MTTYRVRTILPIVTEWQTIEADCPERAANDFHYKNDSWSYRLHDDRVEGQREDILYARIEVEGHESFVSRLYKRGIYRRGGVKNTMPFEDKVKKIAKDLGYKDENPMTLLDPWDFEEDSWA